MLATESNIETLSLTESQWQTAHVIAIELVKNETDVNELGKIKAYLRSIVSNPDAGAKFFKYLNTLVANGKQIGHSGKTLDYYRSIEDVSKEYLSNYRDRPATLLLIIGWAIRLMQYYKTSPVGELEAPKFDAATLNQSQRQAEIKASVQSLSFEAGQIVEAKVISKKGNEVTYEIVGTSIRRNNKEPKKFSELEIDQVVKVQIIELNDGVPKKFKRLD